MGEPVKADADGQWLEGRISTSNLPEAQRIWRMVDQDYTPIDWHIDFKSGYRWLEKTWYRDIKVGHKPGVDVKVPWELARMQHMPQLAFVFQSLPDPSEERILLQRAFRNQVLDFIASNPPRFGINWYYPMDVAIRSANWLMAYDLFRAGKARFDDKFESVFTRSIYEHGHHILGNLEWNDKIRGNHYLADITGLAFIASYLPSTAQTDAWLAFSVQELIAEVEHQFYPDGGNFEGSTAYHRLSAEMVYFATALVLGLPQERLKRLQQCDYPKWLKTGWGKPGLKPGPIPFYKLPKESKASTEESPFPAWYFERLERMAEFIVDITKPDGRIPQIGDNDSGRWFKLAPRYERMTVREARTRFANLEGYAELPDDAEYLMESHLDCSHLVAAAYGLFSWDDFGDRLGGEEETENMPDTICIKALTGGVRIGSQRLSTCKKQGKSSFPIKRRQNLTHTVSEMQKSAMGHFNMTAFAARGGGLYEGLVIRGYEDFGVYLFKSERIYLAVRCWPGREPFLSGHMHNDQLGIELCVDGQPVMADPGSYLYSPLPKDRDRYRSVHGHFTPWPREAEPAMLGPGLFSILTPVKAEVLYLGYEGFVGKLAHGCGAVRSIELREDSVVVTDFADEPFKKEQKRHQIPYSPAYGLVWREFQ